jgi:hypothetical protein
VEVEDDDVVLSAKARKDFLIDTGSSVTKVVVVVVVVVVIASINRCSGTSVPKRYILLVIPRKKKLVIVMVRACDNLWSGLPRIQIHLDRSSRLSSIFAADAYRAKELLSFAPFNVAT